MRPPVPETLLEKQKLVVLKNEARHFLTLSGEDDTPVLEKVETSKRPLRPKLGINEQLALDTYTEATKGRPLLCRLHIDEWRPSFERRHTGDTSKQKNDAQRFADLGSFQLLKKA